VYSGRVTLDTTPFVSREVLTAPSIADFWFRQSKGQNVYVRSLTYYFLITKIKFLHGLQWWQVAPKQKASLFPLAVADALSDSIPVSPEVEAILQELPPDKRAWREVIIPNSLNVVMAHVGALSDMAIGAGAKVVLATFLQNFEKGDPIGITIRVYNQHLREYAQRKGLIVADLERLFAPVPDKEKYFVDQYHPSPLGAEFIAQGLADLWQPNWISQP
jgi:hypothetical protein